MGAILRALRAHASPTQNEGEVGAGPGRGFYRLLSVGFSVFLVGTFSPAVAASMALFLLLFPYPCSQPLRFPWLFHRRGVFGVVSGPSFASP